MEKTGPLINGSDQGVIRHSTCDVFQEACDIPFSKSLEREAAAAMYTSEFPQGLCEGMVKSKTQITAGPND